MSPFHTALPASSLAVEVLLQQTYDSASTLTMGRLWAAVAALLGLAGVVLGALAAARSRRGGAGKGKTVVALAAGLVSAVVGTLVVAAAEGGPGTGYGIVGGYLAIGLGVVSVAFGGLVLVRARRTGSNRAPARDESPARS